MGIEFTILTVFVSVLWAGFLIATRNIQFPYPEEEDSAVMVKAASIFNRWRWPSEMHQPGARATYMKDVSILLIALFQKIFRNKKGPYPMVAMQGFTNAVSAILIFLVGSSYWSPGIGLFLGLLYAISCWPWQMATFMGHINVATMFILLLVYITTLISAGTLTLVSIPLLFAGMLLACLVFCSSSSLKYSPLFFAALAFARYRILADSSTAQSFTSPTEFFLSNIFLNVILLAGLITWLILSNLLYKSFVTAMYRDRLPGVVKKILSLMKRRMSGRKIFSLEHYLNYTKSKLKRFNIWLVWIFVIPFILINIIGFQPLVPVIVGFLAVVLLLTLPDVKKNLGYYWIYVRETQIRMKTTFRHWIGYFAKKGIVVDRYYRSEFIWVPRQLMKRMPIPMILFYLSAAGLILFGLYQGQFQLIALTLLMLIVSLSPIIWAELTHCHRNGRGYFPALPGALLFIGFALFQFSAHSGFINDYFWLAGFPLLTILFAWNLQTFLSDILPARMSVTRLIETLRKNNINKFYTYRTDYNIPLIGTINAEILSKYKIHYIDSLAEVENGCWVVIPGVSNKTALWSTGEMEQGIDFVKDPLLNKLLETRRIEKVATAKLKTFGTSRTWILDSDVTSHRALVLKETGEEDYFRSHAWLLNTRNLRF